MSYVFAFLRFWYHFVIGDDWRIAVGVVVALSVTAVVAATDVPAWGVMPVGVIAILIGSLRRATRPSR
jgi:hypothetical protein